MTSTKSARSIVPGVYVPSMCFFTRDTEDVDAATIAKHVVRLAQAGVTGIATQGSNGEAVHLTQSERKLVTSTTRRVLDDNGFGHLPVIVGCGSQSTRETLQLCRDAHEAGGDCALVLPPSYYAPLFAPAAETIITFFTSVADRSPIPIILYNFPPAAGGLDLSSDVIIRLARHPNIVGVKLTCGNLGKLNRIATATRAMAEETRRPEFLVFAGSADSLVQSLAGGGHGVIGGLANMAPRACVRAMELYNEGRMDEAQAIQAVISHGDWAAIRGGVVGLKAGMQGWLGYGSYARSPVPRASEEQTRDWIEAFRDLMVLEMTL